MRPPRGAAFSALPAFLTLMAIGLAGALWLRAAELRAARAQLDGGARASADAIATRVSDLQGRLALLGALEAPGARDDSAARALLAADSGLLECLRVDGEGRVLGRAARGRPILAEAFSLAQSAWFAEASAGRPYLALGREAAGAPAALIVALPAPGGGAIAARLAATSLDETVGRPLPDLFRGTLRDDQGRLLAASGTSPVELRGLVTEPRSAAPGPGQLRAEAGLRPVAAWAGGGPGEAWKVTVEAPRVAMLGGSGTLGALLLLALLAGALALAVGRRGPGERLAGSVAATAAEIPLGAAEMDDVLARLDAMVDRAREVDRLKSEFLATISHELRTPLNSVIGYAELILSGVNGPVDAETQKDLRAIHENGQQLLRIVNDLLDLAKIEAQRIELELVQLEPAGLLAQAAETWQARAAQKGLRLSWEAEPGLPAVWGDMQRLQQVLSNLISNAIKFTDAGEIRLAARASGEAVAISVSDSGVGIAPEDQETIFERFRQLDGSFTRRAGGTGLGLAIGRQLVRMHGGRLEVESAPGRGTTFTLLLPVEARPSHARGRPVGPLLW